MNYAWLTTVPVDTNVYTITGTVATDVESLVRQTAPAQAQSYNAEGLIPLRPVDWLGLLV
jgi:hypothetical protein